MSSIVFNNVFSIIVLCNVFYIFFILCFTYFYLMFYIFFVLCLTYFYLMFYIFFVLCFSYFLSCVFHILNVWRQGYKRLKGIFL